MKGIGGDRGGEWKEGLAEVGAGRRIWGGAGVVGVMGDWEGGVGGGEKGVDLWGGEEGKEVGGEDVMELGMVGGGGG